MSESRKITIQVNGQPKDVASSTDVNGLLEAMEISNPAVAVEVNASIVARDQFENVVLHQGDVVEIVSLVGGG